MVPPGLSLGTTALLVGPNATVCVSGETLLSIECGTRGAAGRHHACGTAYPTTRGLTPRLPSHGERGGKGRGIWRRQWGPNSEKIQAKAGKQQHKDGSVLHRRHVPGPRWGGRAEGEASPMP